MADLAFFLCGLALLCSLLLYSLLPVVMSVCQAGETIRAEAIFLSSIKGEVIKGTYLLAGFTAFGEWVAGDVSLLFVAIDFLSDFFCDAGAAVAVSLVFFYKFIAGFFQAANPAEAGGAIPAVLMLSLSSSSMVFLLATDTFSVISIPGGVGFCELTDMFLCVALSAHFCGDACVHLILLLSTVMAEDIIAMFSKRGAVKLGKGFGGVTSSTMQGSKRHRIACASPEYRKGRLSICNFLTTD